MKKIIIITGLIISACGAGIYWHLQTAMVTSINENKSEDQNQPAAELSPQNVFLDDVLKEAIQKNNTQLLKQLVDQENLDINQPGLDDITILNYAILCSKKLPINTANNLITFIVKNLGTNINQEDFDENNQSYIPLSFAIEHEVDQSILETLIKLGANVNYRSTPSNVSLLEYAFDIDNTELITFLITHGANINNFNKSGLSILTFAVTKAANNMQDRPKSLALIRAILDGLIVLETDPDQPNQYRANIISSAIVTAKQLNLYPELIALLSEGIR